MPQEQNGQDQHAREQRINHTIDRPGRGGPSPDRTPREGIKRRITPTYSVELSADMIEPPPAQVGVLAADDLNA